MLTLIIYLIFVEPNGEVYTIDEQAYTIQSVQDATLFWGYTTQITTSMIRTDQDVYTLPLDSWAILPSGDHITIYVVDNSASHKLFFNSVAGYAQDYYRLATGLTDTYLPAILAHELGHVLYGLPDWYKTGCQGVDIMCDAVAAYQNHTIGCQTLDYIGKPCKRVYLSEIHK